MADDSIFYRMSVDNFFRLGYYYHVSGDLAAAAEYYIQSIETDPSPEAHTFLSFILGSFGQFREALIECKKALELNPDYGKAWNAAGLFLLEQKKFNKAISYFQKASKLKSYDAPEQAHFNLARIYNHKGMLLKSIKELKKAIKLKADFDAAKQMLVQVENQLH